VIPANKQPRFARWFAGRCRARLAADFHRVEAHGLGHLRAALAEAPVLLVSNHVSWWDAVLAVTLGHLHLDCDGYAMMDARNVRRLPFFARVGGFGVDRGDGDAAALEYAAGLLDRPGRMVWVFPQGDERPATLRPLGFRRGAAVVARAAPSARVVPLALRYEVGHWPRPCAHLAFGPGRAARDDVEDERAAQEAGVAALLDRLDDHLCGRAALPFETLVEGRRQPLAAFAEATLARVSRRHLA
jgi:1-acyl-sn-glycerol-3-phosphate acyltransferase